jgi:two-component system, OmpR family, response regulator
VLNTIKTDALIIDDEVDICYLLAEILKSKNIHCSYVHTLNDARKILGMINPGIVFLDNHLPDGMGLDFINHIKLSCPQAKILVITAHDKSIFRERALEAGAFEFINKPFTSDGIFNVINKMISKDEKKQ